MDGVEASLRVETDPYRPVPVHGNDSVTPIEETIRALDTGAARKVRYIDALTGKHGVAKALASPSSGTSPDSDTLQAYY